MKEFYDEIYELKKLIRRGWLLRLDNSKRLESDAEHIFSCCLLAMKVIEDKKLDIDRDKVLRILLYHEIGEIEVGDITIADGVSVEEKYQREQKAVKAFAEKYNMPEIYALWEEFEENKTEEAKFCKMIDKLDTILQSKEYCLDVGNDAIYEEFLETSRKRIAGYEDLLTPYIAKRKDY